MPNLTGWMQELTAQAGYDRIQDLARTYWAHFPIASYLGYDSPDQDTEESKGVPEWSLGQMKSLEKF